MINEVKLNEEVIHLKKSKVFGGGWRVVHPINNKDGSINWINLLVGGWGNLIVLIFLALLLYFSYVGITEILESCRDMAAHPCNYFTQEVIRNCEISKMAGRNIL